MKKALVSAVSIVALLGAMAFAQSEGVVATHIPASGAVKGGRLYAQERSLTATVASIDYQTRNVSLTMPDNSVVSFTAGPEIKRLNEIKQGDQVKIQYLQSVALVLRKPNDGEVPGAAANTVMVRGKGKHPAGAVVTTVDVIAEVTKVDKKAHTVSIKGPQGDTSIVEVPASVGNLSKVKVGDHVYVQYTQALAMAIVPAKSTATNAQMK